MKTIMILFTAVALTVAALACACRSQAVSKEPNEIDQVIDEAIVRGADIPPAKRGLIIRMLRLNEKDLLLGLRAYADLSGGRYPPAWRPRPR